MGELEGVPSLFCTLFLLPRLLACHDQCVRPLIVSHVETIAQDIIEKGFALADGLIEFGIEIHIAAKHFFVVGSQICVCQKRLERTHLCAKIGGALRDALLQKRIVGIVVGRSHQLLILNMKAMGNREEVVLKSQLLFAKTLQCGGILLVEMFFQMAQKER